MDDVEDSKLYYETLGRYNKRIVDFPTEDIKETQLGYANRGSYSANTPIEKVINTTGYSREHVMSKIGLIYGLHQQETGGSSGLLGGEHRGMIKTYLKNNYSTTTTAFLKSLSEKDVPFIGSDWEGHVIDAERTPSAGVLRIKLQDQMYQVDENGDFTDQLTELGEWYTTMGITDASMLTSGDETDFPYRDYSLQERLVEQEPGDRGKYNSYTAGLLQLLYYDQRVRKMEGFDSETDELNGIPINYVIVSMHKNPNLRNKLYSGDMSSINYMEQGDRDYSNNVIQHAQNVLTSHTDLRSTEHAEYLGTWEDQDGNYYSGSHNQSREEMIRYFGEEDVANLTFKPKYNTNNPEYKVDNTPKTSYDKELKYWQAKGKSLQGQVSKTSEYSGHTDAVNTFFKEGESEKVLSNLNKINEPDTQTRYLIKKLEYGQRISEVHPDYSDEKILELMEEQFLGMNIPPEDIDVYSLPMPLTDSEKEQIEIKNNMKKATKKFNPNTDLRLPASTFKLEIKTINNN